MGAYMGCSGKWFCPSLCLSIHHISFMDESSWGAPSITSLGVSHIFRLFGYFSSWAFHRQSEWIILVLGWSAGVANCCSHLSNYYY